MTLQDVLRAVSKRWLLAVVITVVGIVTGAGTALSAPASYVSSSTILLRWVGPNAEYAISENVRYMRERAPTYSSLVHRRSVLARAIDETGLDMTVEDLDSHVEAKAPVDSQTIRVRVSSTKADESSLLADAVAKSLTREVASEEGGAGVSAATVDALIVVKSVTPTSPDTPRKILYLAVGAFLGAVLGTGTAVVIERVFMVSRPRRGVGTSSVQDPSPQRIGLPHLAWLAMIAAVIPWRTNTFYQSGADPVVLAKAAVSLVALGISFWAFRRSSQQHPIPAAPLIILLVYFSTTVIGGLANDDLVPSLVVTIRVVILIAAISLLTVAHGPQRAMSSLMHVLGAVVLAGALSGLPGYSGRLGGTIPPLNPNALAFITAVVAIWLFARVTAGRDRSWEIFAVAGCLVVVYLTGSRSTLAALAIASLMMCFRITALRKATLLIIAASLPFATFLAFGTSLISDVFTRGGSEQISTLSNRTIAWREAVTIQRDGWQTWFGQGLAQKKIAVPGQWWDTQLLDSSWLSALIQGGNLGLVLVVVLGTATLFRAAFSRRERGAASLGLSVLTVLVGILESGLFDGSILFIVFLMTSLGAFGQHVERVPSDRRDALTLTSKNLNERVNLRASPMAKMA